MYDPGNWAATRPAVPAVGVGGNQRPLEVNTQGDLLASQNLPERSQLVSYGRSYTAQIKEANAFTLLITVPTTLAGLALQNPVGSGKILLIDRVWLKCVTSTASAGAVTILVQNTAPGTAAVAQSANVTNGNIAGRGQTTPTYDGVAVQAVASTATGALQDRWVPIGTGGLLSATTNIAAVVEAFCYGRYVVPQGGVFNIGAQESVSGGTAILGVEWHEVAMPVGS